MRFALAFALMFTLANSALAQDAAPNKIQVAMKIMGTNLKAISQTPVDATTQASLVAKAQEIRAQILSVVGETPEVVKTSVPADQIASARLVYEKMMLVLAAQAVDLEVALRKGDQAQVKDAISAMGDTKSDGHDQFKP